MSQQLLRSARDALDSFKQAYPENWHEDDQKVMDDLLKADLDLSGVKRKWVGLTDDEKLHIEIMGGKSDVMLAEMVEAKLKELNT